MRYLHEMEVLLAAARRTTRGADGRPVGAGFERKSQVIWSSIEGFRSDLVPQAQPENTAFECVHHLTSR